MDMPSKFIIALIHVDMEHGYVGDIIEGVGARQSTVSLAANAKRYSSLKRALAAAETWTWYADIIRVIKVDE